MKQVLKPFSNQYPYIVIRIIPAVYNTRKIRFVKDINAEKSSSDLLIEEPNPYIDGKSTESVKQTIVKITLDWSKRINKRLCAVFGPQECVYCEPDGSSTPQRCIPCGGLNLTNQK